MKTIILFIEKLYNTLVFNGLFVILSIVFPFVFFYYDAGKDIVNGLMGEGNHLTILFSAFSFFMLSLSLWCIPVLAIPIFKFFTNTEFDNFEIFNKIEKYYNGESIYKNSGERKVQIDVKYLALIPWFIFTIALIFTASEEVKLYMWIIYILVLVGSICIINVQFKKYQDNLKLYIDTDNEKWRFLIWSVLFFIVYFMASYLVFKIINMEEYIALKQFFICIYFFIASIAVYVFLKILDLIKMDDLDENNAFKTTKNFSYRSSHYIHIFCIGLSILSYIIFYFLNRNALLGKVNPIVVSIMLTCLIILFIELFITSQILIIKLLNINNNKTKLYRIGVNVFTILLFMSYFFFSTNESLIRTEKLVKFEKENYERDSLEVYFDNWYNSKIKCATTDSINIFLVSGQGGGSRAGTWFLGNMMKIDQESPDFYNYIFSISTVSGSSSGANMYIAKHYMDNYITSEDPKKYWEIVNKPNLKKDTIINDFIKSTYGANYISSGVFGLLLNDFLVDSFTNIAFDENRDRNYSLQNEEMKNFEKAFLEYYGYQDLEEKNKLNFQKKIQDYFIGDYLNLYNNESTKFKHPLFFINTTLVNSGSKGVFSPVLMNSISKSEDVYGNFRNCTENDYLGLPMVACVNQSQAFPFLNSYNYVHGSGRLADGGMWENTGIETTMEIYKKITNRISQKKYKANVFLVTLINGKINENVDPSYTKPSFLNTITALTKSPFYGREYLAFQNAKLQVNAKNNISFSPEKSYTLTRFFNKNHIDSILVEINKSTEYSSSRTAIVGRVEKSKLNCAPKVGDIKNKTFVYIQYYDYGQKNVDTLVKNLTNYYVKPVEKMKFKTSPDIRYFHEKDTSAVFAIQKIIREKTKFKTIPIKNFSAKYPYVPEGQIEIWLD